MMKMKEGQGTNAEFSLVATIHTRIRLITNSLIH